MSKEIKQIRYYGDKNIANYPSKLGRAALTSGSIFNDYYPITYLRIIGPSGIKFQVNGGDGYVMLGSSGFYELDLTNFDEIKQLKFEQNSIKETIDSITTNNSYLIIDIIYEK